jgi:hypothetical protein
MSKLQASRNIRTNVPGEGNWMAQVGWLGQTGEVYALDTGPTKDQEPGEFMPLYIEDGD